MVVFPIQINFRGRVAVVIGGGSVGRRKIDALLPAGATVRVVDPASRPGDLDPSVEWSAEPYGPDHLAGAMLVIAAGPPAVNETVVTDARTAGIWVCDAADPARGDFVLPSTVRIGALTVSVGTGGASPGLARRIKDKFAADLDPSYADWVGLLSAVRPLARETIADPTIRRRVLDELADWPWRDRIRDVGSDAALAEMRAVILRAGKPADDGLL